MTKVRVERKLIDQGRRENDAFVLGYAADIVGSGQSSTTRAVAANAVPSLRGGCVPPPFQFTQNSFLEHHV